LLLAGATVPFLHLTARANEIKASGGDQTRELQAAIDAAGENGAVRLGPGTFQTGTLKVSKNVTLEGVPTATKLRVTSGQEALVLVGGRHVSVQGIGFSGKGKKGNLIWANGIERLIVEDCDFQGGASGIRTQDCGGRIVGNRMRFHQQAALQAISSTGLEISGNTVTDIGNNGIQVWRDQKGDNPTIVSNNIIARIAAEDGGDGPNGNGINIYNSHGSIVSNNRITDCELTAVRNASSELCIITGNNIARCNETALYVEFEFLGAVISNNIIDTASQGISITNFLQGGRLAQCTGNVVRNIRGKDRHGRDLGGGIAAEADTVIANNVLDNVQRYGISLGWGKYARNLNASNNVLQGCERGIIFSAVGPGPFVITNNIISGSKHGAIFGMDHYDVVTGDLALKDAKAPEQASISGNIVKS
jgi:uncharacterized secreted repeat protein (TIGR03808 family)